MSLTRRQILAAGAGSAALVATPAAAKPSRSKRNLLPAPGPIAARGGDPADLSAVEAASLLQARRLSSAELTAACQRRIARRDPAITAWTRRYDDLAALGARDADRRLNRRGRAAPLICGLPLGLKDLYAVAGKPLTAGSRILEGNVAKGDCGAWVRLRFNGMVLLGHTHTHEFAFGTGTPQTANPWALDRSPGGSSGGSGAALAARTVPAALGSDTRGSLRYPASLANATSVKPTYGLVSSAGVIPLSWSLDHCGPMARSAVDCSLLLSYLAGRDGDDPVTRSADPPPPLYPLGPRTGRRPLAGTRIGVPGNGPAYAPGIGAAYDRFLAELAGLGAELVRFSAPPHPNPNGDATAILTILGAEASAYHEAWFPSRAGDYTPPVAQLLAATRAASGTAVAYVRAQRDRTTLAQRWNSAFADLRLDAVAQPALTGEPATRAQAQGPTVAALAVHDGPVGAWNETGFPVVTTPAGRSTASNLPIGMQLAGPPFTEAALLRIAIDHQAAHEYWREAPEGLA